MQRWDIYNQILFGDEMFFIWNILTTQNATKSAILSPIYIIVFTTKKTLKTASVF
jgi:hypothetical protein